jgi:hypothetical protein
MPKSLRNIRFCVKYIDKIGAISFQISTRSIHLFFQYELRFHMLRKLLFTALFYSFYAVSQLASASTLINVDFNGSNNDNGGTTGGPTATGAAVIGNAGDT